MREVLKRPRAYADLEDIWLYTHEQWGEKQADRYMRRLDEALKELAGSPERGKSAETIRAGYYSIHIGRHLVFYTFTDTIVSVRRVLHDQMDVGRHL
ncbi:MAG: type II toxin-antitoxin system RelE/ParE family toxin [Planctomycetes bacterium]|nr:type II toxin-antitoxin system RelE/ParE family toxin [Planctomycetota bacterium]